MKTINLVVGCIVLLNAGACGSGEGTLANSSGGESADLDRPTEASSGAEAGQVNIAVGANTEIADPGASARFDAMVSIVGQEMATLVRDFQPNRDVFTLHFETGTTITWMEPSPGSVLLLQHYVNGAVAPSTAGARTAADMFRAVAPGEEVPPELIALDERAALMVPVMRALSDATADVPWISPVPDVEDYAVHELPPNPHVVPVAIDSLETSGQFDVVGSGLAQNTFDINSCVDQASGCGAVPTFDFLEVQNLVQSSTSNKTIRDGNRDDHSAAYGIGCSQVGNIHWLFQHDCGFWCSLTTVFNGDLSVGSGVIWSHGDSDDFWFKTVLSGLEGTDRGAQCAYGYYD